MTDYEAMARRRRHYHHANATRFDNLLPASYRIVWYPLLRRLTGRITCGSRLIEIATIHYRRYGYEDAVATLEHEMLHLCLDRLRLPSGHNRIFKREARRLGIRVFHDNDYRRNTPPRDRHMYCCPACGRMVFRQRRITRRLIACGIAGGAWDERFQLAFVHKVRIA